VTPAPSPVDDIRVCEPSTRPGAPLPHAWIDDEDGNHRALRELVAPGRFVLIAGEDGDAWCGAARRLAADADIPVDSVRIGHSARSSPVPRAQCCSRRVRESGGVGRVPQDASRDPVREAGGLATAVQVPGGVAKVS
jgi:2,4-dichlorophenol 6-monooxygenase